MANLLKGLGSVVNKAQAGMAAMDLEAQRKAKENTVKQMIQQLKDQRENVFARIGKEYYAAYKEDLSVGEPFRELLNILIQNEKDMDSQEKQLEDINSKYEEEVRLLRGENKPETAKCPKCGLEYKPGVNLFCSECGEDLRKPVTEAEAAACPGCGTPFDPAHARFCKKCGHKLVEE